MIANTFLKELLFSTVRIIADTDLIDQKNIGTGFLVIKKVSETEQQIFLVTNKHVIAKTDNTGKVIGKFTKGTFSFIKSEKNNPKLGDSFSVNIENLTDSFVLHPDESVDLAIFNISDLYTHITQTLHQEVFIRAIPLEMIPSENDTFDAIEDIYFIGYPNGLYDQKNHLPIMRKGITASPYEVDFGGSRKFLIDAQVFPGSSGSPIFIKEQNLKGGSLRLGSEKYFFAGVLSQVFQRDQVGVFKQIIAPTSIQESAFSIQQMIGLGICEKSHQILDLIEIINKK